jgi:heterodisulfide reductase subunit C
MLNIEKLADQYGLFLCVECGKCVAVCPMEEIYTQVSYEMSPRGIIERILLDPELPEDDCMWFCLTCDLCTNLCPAGVRFRDFVEVIRQVAMKTGVTEYSSFCESCGTYLYPQHILAHLKQVLDGNTEELLRHCPRCRRYEIGGKVKAQLPGKRQVGSPTMQIGNNR